MIIQLDQTYAEKLKPVIRSLVVLMVILLISCLTPSWLVNKDLAAYFHFPFHILLEAITIIVSMMVFAVCWGVKIEDRPGNFSILASIFFGVALLTFMHTITLNNMPSFISLSSQDKGILFSLAARVLSCTGFLVVSVSCWRALGSKMNRWITLSLILMIVSLVIWVGLWHPEWTPHFYIEGHGQTNIKTWSEYFLMALYLFCAFLFFSQMNKTRPYDVVGLFAASSIMAMSEFFFVTYLEPADIFSLLGHLYKLIGYACIYQSIFVDGIKLPYRRLNESNKKLEQEVFDRKKIEKQLATNERLLSSILYTLPVAVFAKDIKKDFQYKVWNKFAEKLSGLKAEDLIGKFDYDFFLKEEADWFRAKDIEASQSKEIIEIPEEIVQTKNGPVALHTRKTSVSDNLGDPVLLVGVSEDISEIKKVTNDLHNALNARDEFLLIASHELKTPISSLKLRLQAMRRHLSADDKMVKEIDPIVVQVDRLTKLIDAILDVSRIQSGKFTLELISVNLARTVAEVLEQFAEELADSKFQVEVNIPPEIIGIWDQARIEQLLANLLSNAIKYAPGSQITLLATRDEKKTTLCFKDSGPGIPKEKQALLFNRFERLNAPVNTSGLGLGLFICKQIVEAHCGTIRVEGQEGPGTSFIIELPNSSPVVPCRDI